MIASVLPPAVVFMLGTAARAVRELSGSALQRARVDAHAQSASMMASILLAAGVFTGIMQGSGMLDAMAAAAVVHVPRRGGSHIPFALGLLSMPLSLLFDPDSFYFGVCRWSRRRRGVGSPGRRGRPGGAAGTDDDGISGQPADAVDVPARRTHRGGSGEHQRFSIPFLWATSIVMTTACVAAGSVPAVRGRTLRVGAGAGYSGDRIEPAVQLAAHGPSTTWSSSASRSERSHWPSRRSARDERAGFDPLLLDRMRAVLPICRANGVRSSRTWGPRIPRRAADAVRDACQGRSGSRVFESLPSLATTCWRRYGRATMPSWKQASLSSRSRIASCLPMPTSAPSPSSRRLGRMRMS